MTDENKSALLRAAQDILTDCRSGVISKDAAIIKLRAILDGSRARQAMAATSQDRVWHGSRPQAR